MTTHDDENGDDRAWALAQARAFLAPRPAEREREREPEPTDQGKERVDAESLLRGDAARVWTVTPLPVPAEDATASKGATTGEGAGESTTMEEEQ